MDVSTSLSLLSAEYNYVVSWWRRVWRWDVVCRRRIMSEVIVLEAGNSHLTDPRVNTPAGWSALLGSEVDWRFKTSAQEHRAGRSLRHHQGRVFGGSSAINAEAFSAPSSADLDPWERLGNPGWSWQMMMPYYRKCYTLTSPAPETAHHLGIDWIDEDIHGRSGFLQASFQGVVQDPLSKAWVETFKGLQYGLHSGPFAGEAMCGYSSPITVDLASKTRSYAANIYFASAAQRPNLTVLTGVSVDNILLESGSGPFTAKGVRVTVDDTQYMAKASNEAMLAAGPFQTPKLLELSGIGDRQKRARKSRNSCRSWQP